MTVRLYFQIELDCSGFLGIRERIDIDVVNINFNVEFRIGVGIDVDLVLPVDHIDDRGVGLGRHGRRGIGH